MGYSVLLPDVDRVFHTQTTSAIAVEGSEHFIEALLVEVAVQRIQTSIRAMLRLVPTCHINPEERIWQPAMAKPSWIRKPERNQQSTYGEYDAEAKFPESQINVVRPDDSITIAIPEENMFLESGQRSKRMSCFIVLESLVLRYVVVVIVSATCVAIRHSSSVKLGVLEVLGFVRRGWRDGGGNMHGV